MNTTLLKQNEESILLQCKQNDSRAQELIYKRYFGYVMHFTLSYTKNKSDAHELANTVFFKFFSKINRFDETKPLKPWLKRLTVNTCIDFIRSQKRRRMISEDMNEYTQIAAHIENGGEMALEKNDIISALNSIPNQYKNVFTLYAIGGFSHKEIAEQLGISIGASKSNYHRARKKLQAQLTELYSYCTIENQSQVQYGL